MNTHEIGKIALGKRTPQIQHFTRASYKSMIMNSVKNLLIAYYPDC